MPGYKVSIKCEKEHKLYNACYRGNNPEKMGRIKGVLYCPDCNEFYNDKSEKIKVTFR